MKRKRLLRKYNMEKTENLDQVIEELKQIVSAWTQRLSRYRKSQNQYYQNNNNNNTERCICCVFEHTEMLKSVTLLGVKESHNHEVCQMGPPL